MRKKPFSHGVSKIRPDLMAARLPATDILRPFQIERSALRGRVLRLGDTVDRVLNAHAYPAPVSMLLGELLVLAGGFAGALKFEGTFSLQIRGDGPVSLMVADIDNAGTMRGYASFDQAGAESCGEDGLEALVGDGVMALTVDQAHADGQVYQGIVKLGGQSLQDSMLEYFWQSEQVPTGIRAAVHHDPVSGSWLAGAVIVQAMPGEAKDRHSEGSGGGSGGGPSWVVSRGSSRASGDGSDDGWRRTMQLLQTVTDQELVNPALPLDTLLLRLFHEDGIRVFDPLSLSFGCSCSEERVCDVLRRFTPVEVEEMRDESGRVTVTCEICSEVYRFDDAEMRKIIGGSLN